MNRVELRPRCEGVNVVNIESTCIDSADQGHWRNGSRVRVSRSAISQK